MTPLAALAGWCLVNLALLAAVGACFTAHGLWKLQQEREAERGRPPAGVLRFPDQLELRRRARGAVGRRG